MSRTTACLSLTLTLATSLLALSCSGTEATQTSSQRVVYGSDDRREFYEVDDPALRRVIQQSVVALIPNEFLVDGALAQSVVPTYGETEALCPDQPYAEQPEAAFCSGVLVDYDLVLTAGHCVRALALTDFSVVFDYYYAAANRLALESASIYAAREISAFRRDPPSSAPRLDFGWIRLAREVDDARHPLAVRTQDTGLEPGQPILAIGAENGLPVKVDGAAAVQDPRGSSRDYFTASSDTARGGSGGPALDATLTLVGILSRGSADIATKNDCNVEATLPEGASGDEQFTYAARAVERLCAESVSSLCRSDCGSPCEALRASVPSEAGCSAASAPRGPAPSRPFIVLIFALVSYAMTLRRRPGLRANFHDA